MELFERAGLFADDDVEKFHEGGNLPIFSTSR
jgi:hypothetical protein